MKHTLHNTKDGIIKFFVKKLGLELVVLSTLLVMYPFFTDLKDIQLYYLILTIYFVMFVVNFYQLQKLLVYRLSVSKSKVKLGRFMYFNKSLNVFPIKKITITLKEVFSINEMKTFTILKIQSELGVNFIYPSSTITQNDIVDFYYAYKTMKIETISDKELQILEKMKVEVPIENKVFTAV